MGLCHLEPSSSVDYHNASVFAKGINDQHLYLRESEKAQLNAIYRYATAVALAFEEMRINRTQVDEKFAYKNSEMRTNEKK